jgi:hypothetical protein
MENLSSNHEFMTSNLENYINPENKDFVDNFNQLIEDSHNRWLEKIKSNPNYPNDESESNEKINTKKKHKKPMEDIFKDPPSWKPPFNYPKEFDKLKILRHKTQMTDTELVSSIIIFYH